MRDAERAAAGADAKRVETAGLDLAVDRRNMNVEEIRDLLDLHRPLAVRLGLGQDTPPLCVAKGADAARFTSLRMNTWFSYVHIDVKGRAVIGVRGARRGPADGGVLN